jgi:hypothetical protein
MGEERLAPADGFDLPFSQEQEPLEEGGARRRRWCAERR